MFAAFITVALYAAANVAGYTLSTPQLTQCQDATINWDSATGSVNLIAVPADDVCNGKILADLGDHDGSSGSTTWKVDVPAGTKLVLTTLDSADVEAWSAEITVQPSDDDSCVRDEYKTASSSSSSSSTAASSSSSSAAGTLVVTPTAAASTSYSSPNSNTNSDSNANKPVGGVASDPLTSKNGALTHATKPMLVLGAISAVLAASL